MRLNDAQVVFLLGFWCGGERMRIELQHGVDETIERTRKEMQHEVDKTIDRLNNEVGAIGNFDEAIRLNPNDAQSYNIRGNVWGELGIPERSLADYDASLRIDPNNPAVLHDRAILWQRKGALDKATRRPKWRNPIQLR